MVNPITNFFNYFKGCREELTKVSHPTRQETVQATIVTMIIMVFVAFSLFIMDIVFNAFIGYVVS